MWLIKEVQGVKLKGKQPRAADNIGRGDHPLKEAMHFTIYVTATKLHKALFEYIIKDMQPLSTVDSPSFQKLIGNICPYQLLDRKSFTQHMEKLYDFMVKKVKEALEVVDGVSTTADT